MIYLGKLYDSYLCAEVLFSPLCFILPQFLVLKKLSGKFPNSFRGYHFLPHATDFQVLSSEQKEEEILLPVAGSFLPGKGNPEVFQTQPAFRTY